MANTDLKNAPLYFAGDIKNPEFLNALSFAAPFMIKGAVYSANAPIYDLSDYVLLAENYGLSLAVDLSGADNKTISDICGALKSANAPLKFLSGDKNVLLAVKEKFPRAEFMLRTGFFDVTVIPDLLISGFSADVYYDKLTLERVRDLHALNIKTFCHGVSEADVAALLTYFKVDGIITDTPRVFKHP